MALSEILVNEERAVLQEWIGEIFGYELICAGSFCEQLAETIVSSPISHKTWLTSQVCDTPPGLVLVRSDLENLPVASDSADLLLLPHALDTLKNPQQLMREVDRVLIPEGRIILTGINPWSLWGGYGMLGGKKYIPWCDKPISLGKLRDWFGLLGFEVERHRMLVFRPPVISERYCVLDSLGPRFWSGLGSVYVVQAVKRVSTLTLIRPRWKLAKKVIGVEPVNRATRGVHERQR